MKPEVEIIVIQYNQPELGKRCLESVRHNTHYPYLLTVYDNSQEKCNLGTLWNRLAKESKNNYLCFLNDDTNVEPRWLRKLTEVFKREKNVGAVGPTTNSSSNFQSKEFPSNKKYDIVDVDLTYPEWHLGGFCLLISKEVFNKVGGFPEDFGFYGQETAFLVKMRKLGYRQLWRKDVFIWHYGSASVKKAEGKGEIKQEEEKRVARERIEELKKALC